jgi:HPt (histidine-containing phosphotransfer) domain-containing protein
MNKLEQFEQMLKSHDWSHSMSDDHSRYKAGVESAKKLKAFAVEIDSDPARDMWNLYAYEPSFTKGRVPMAYPEGKK